MQLVLINALIRSIFEHQSGSVNQISVDYRIKKYRIYLYDKN